MFCEATASRNKRAALSGKRQRRCEPWGGGNRECLEVPRALLDIQPLDRAEGTLLARIDSASDEEVPDAHRRQCTHARHTESGRWLPSSGASGYVQSLASGQSPAALPLATCDIHDAAKGSGGCPASRLQERWYR